MWTSTLREELEELFDPRTFERTHEALEEVVAFKAGRERTTYPRRRPRLTLAERAEQLERREEARRELEAWENEKRRRRGVDGNKHKRRRAPWLPVDPRAARREQRRRLTVLVRELRAALAPRPIPPIGRSIELEARFQRRAPARRATTTRPRPGKVRTSDPMLRARRDARCGEKDRLKHSAPPARFSTE